jgi:hypothetical protein
MIGKAYIVALHIIEEFSVYLFGVHIQYSIDMGLKYLSFRGLGSK